MVLINLLQIFKKILKKFLFKRFYNIKFATNGMLDPILYKKFYDIGKVHKNNIFLEIGGAHGAISISVALGIKENNGHGKIIVFEKCIEGSRKKYGGYDKNFEIINNNFKKFNVANEIFLIPKLLNTETAFEAKKIIGDKNISVLIIDADGFLHRDFSFFYNLVRDNGTIIIDDYDKNKLFKKKKWITYQIVNIFFKYKLIEKKFLFKDTLFASKNKNIYWSSEIYLQCEKVILEAKKKFKK